jgi:hypothetical protein
MSAGSAIQAAIVAALGPIEPLTGIYDGPPARAPFPYLVVDAGSEGDWSHKSGQGREVLVSLTIWDDQPARLHGLGDAVEVAMQGLGQPSGWQLVSLRPIRRRTVRDVAGPWASAIDYRGRLLAD